MEMYQRFEGPDFSFDTHGGWFADIVEHQEVLPGDKTILRSVITTSALNRKGHIMVMKGALLDNFKKNPIVLWMHDHFELPMGRSLDVIIKRNNIEAVTEFAPHPFAQELFNLYKEDYLRAFSIGFRPRKHEFIDDEQGRVVAMKILDWELLEYSGVTIGANPDALKKNSLAHSIREAARKAIISGQTADLLLSVPPASPPATPGPDEASDDIDLAGLEEAVFKTGTLVSASVLQHNLNRRKPKCDS